MPFSPFQSIVRGTFTAILVTQMGVLPLEAQSVMQQDVPPASRPLQTHQESMKPAGTPLSQDEKILMALSRFTYGPRPGDLEHVRSIGLSAWFQAQLTPQSIDDSELEKRMSAFPAMQLPLEQLMEMYPDNNALRVSMNRGINRPSGDAANAIYRDGQQRYEDRQKKKKDNTNAGSMDSASSPETSVDVAALLAMTPDKRFHAICKLTLDQWQELRKSSNPLQRQQLLDGLTPQQTEALAAFTGPQRVISAEDVQAKIMRDIYTERQLQEVMVDFWLNHFNVYIKKNQQAPYYIASYVRQAILPNALGNFTRLLAATATSPAMLNYLDNSESIGPHSAFAVSGPYRGGSKQKPSGLNENYARELMELHTIGVNGGYTQHDVTEVAKVFTGWTVDKRDPGAQQAQATFDMSKHEPGDKMVLGHKIKWAGSQEGFAVLKILAESPQCARFISTKLAVRFVADDPPPALIDRMAGTFLETKGDIRRVLITMINSPEFFTTTEYRAKVKTPQDFVVSAVRAAGSDVASTAGLVAAISDLGMPVYGMQTPQGYSMKSDTWSSTTALVSRMNFALALASNRIVGVHTDLEKLVGDDPDKAHALEVKLLHIPVSDRTNRLIEAEVSTDPEKQLAELKQVSVIGRGQDPLLTTVDNPLITKDLRDTDTQAAIAVGLLLGSPEFQRR